MFCNVSSLVSFVFSGQLFVDSLYFDGVSSFFSLDLMKFSIKRKMVADPTYLHNFLVCLRDFLVIGNKYIFYRNAVVT